MRNSKNSNFGPERFSGMQSEKLVARKNGTKMPWVLVGHPVLGSIVDLATLNVEAEVDLLHDTTHESVIRTESHSITLDVSPGDLRL